MGIKLVEKKRNVFKVEILYSQIGDYIGSGGTDMGVAYEQEFETHHFSENVLPYIEMMLQYSGGLLKNNKPEGIEPVANMNTGNKTYQQVWDKLSEEGLIEFGVEYLEDITMEHIDGNGKSYDVELSARKKD